MVQFHHSTLIPLRFTDQDQFRHVNNNTFFSLFDTAKVQYFSEIFGNEFFEKRGIVVANINADFMSPVFFPGNVRIQTSVTKIGTKSLTVMQRMSDPESGEIRCECRTVMVVFDLDSQTSIVLSDDEKEIIRKFESR